MPPSPSLLNHLTHPKEAKISLFEPYLMRLNQLKTQFSYSQQLPSGWSPLKQAPTEGRAAKSWPKALVQMSKALAQRVQEDAITGPARAQWLLRWCQQEGMSIEQVLSQLHQRDFYSVHQYIAQWLAQAGIQHASLEMLEHLRLAPMRLPRMNAKAALALIQRFHQAQNPPAAKWLQRFVKTQRLALTHADEDTAWCLDTPFGAYVRVDYQPNLTSLMTLMHELGHAYHQDQHRVQSGRPLRQIEKETAALRAEQLLLLWLAKQPPPFPMAVQTYRQYLDVEMTQRQRMLSQFEFDLYRLPTFTPNHISTLWRQHIQHFYGPQIELDDFDAESWSELPQLLTAPFYRLSYSAAYARASVGLPQAT